MEKLKFDNRARRKVKTCPCGRSNKDGKFSPLQGFEDKGKCHSCGVFFSPNSNFDSEAWRKSDQWKQAVTPPSVTEPNFIDEATVKQTFQRYNENNFVEFLNRVFKNDPSVLTDVVNRFSIGTSQRWHGATIFWQRDIKGNYRTGEVKLYDSTTGKRDPTKNDWTHAIGKRKGLLSDSFNMVQCFSGEYQLATENKPVAVVESVKTALLMSQIEPRYTWLASNGVSGLILEKCEVLEGRNVVLYPDLGKFQDWRDKAVEFQNLLKINIKVSDLLENYVFQLPETARNDHIKSGFDIADYALKFDWYAEVLRAKQPKTLPLSKDELTLQNMIQKQPLTKVLIEKLGLVNAKTMQSFQNI